MRARVFNTAMLLCAAVALIGTSPVRAATTVTFKSNYEETIKVYVYAANDIAAVIPLKVFEIDPNKSADWAEAPRSFQVKVFKPQFLDKLLAAKNAVPYNSLITLHKDNTIAVAGKPSLVFRNDSGKRLKFAAYAANDKVMAIALQTWTIDSGKTVTWPDAPATFTLKLFEPAIIDKLVTTKTGVADRKTVRVTAKSGSYIVSFN